MSVYRVKLNVWVAVEASNAKSAKAVAENAVRHAVAAAYQDEAEGIRPRFASTWELFGFQAVGTPEKVGDDE